MSTTTVARCPPGRDMNTAKKEEAVWRMALSRVPGIGVAYTKKLIRSFGDAASVFRATGSQLLSAGLPEDRLPAVLEFNGQAQLEAEVELLYSKNIRLIYFTDSDYPQRLLSIRDAPPLLYYEGNADLNTNKIVAMVGTRSADEYGRQITGQIVQQLRPVGALIVSGLASGIDAAAHKAAIGADVPTVGVLGNGLGQVYPVENRSLSRTMTKKGGLLTTLPYDAKAERYHFPNRNRWVAGMCDALIVVQTPRKGGSMLTVAHAREMRKPIYAVPGRLSDSQSEGCNQLIQQGIARMLCSGKQLAADMGWAWPQGGVGTQASLAFGPGDGPLAPGSGDDGGLALEPRDRGSAEGRLLELIREKNTPDIDELVACSNLDASVLALLLLELELRGAIAVLPGKRYTPAGGG
jgi:DNA processing protein